LWLTCLVVASCRPPGPARTLRQIVAVGDSYASGQGAPNKPINPWLLRCEPTWDDKWCNRSENAAAKRALPMLEQQFPADHFELTSYACSGASIERGLLGPYRGTQPPDATSMLDPQVTAVRNFAQKNRIDALVVTIGGNDILFEYIVAACIFGGDCRIIDPVVDDRLRALPARLEKVADALAQIQIPPERIFLLEYPDPTHSTSGAYCDHQPFPDPLSGIAGCEARWASECVLPRLNHELCRTAQLHGWNYVSGIAPAFDAHGWCALDHWINTIDESVLRQGHFRGGVHPNKNGYDAIAKPLAAAIAARLAGGAPAPLACPPVPAACADRCATAPAAR